MEEGSKETKEAIYEIIRNQIQNNDPHDTKITYDRLLKAGKSKQEVMDFIGTVVSVEIFEILKNKTEFNKNRFVKICIVYQGYLFIDIMQNVIELKYSNLLKL